MTSKLDYLVSLTTVGLSHAEYRVLTRIALHTDQFGRTAFPSEATLAEEAEAGERYVATVLQSLVDKGAIRLAKRGGNAVHWGWANSYDVDLEWPAQQVPIVAAKRAEERAAREVARSGKGAVTAPLKGAVRAEKGAVRAEKGAVRAPHPGIDPGIDPVLVNPGIGKQPPLPPKRLRPAGTTAKDLLLREENAGASAEQAAAGSSSRQTVESSASSSGRTREDEPCGDCGGSGFHWSNGPKGCDTCHRVDLRCWDHDEVAHVIPQPDGTYACPTCNPDARIGIPQATEDGATTQEEPCRSTSA